MSSSSSSVLQCTVLTTVRSKRQNMIKQYSVEQDICSIAKYDLILTLWSMSRRRVGRHSTGTLRYEFKRTVYFLKKWKTINQNRFSILFLYITSGDDRSRKISVIGSNVLNTLIVVHHVIIILYIVCVTYWKCHIIKRRAVYISMGSQHLKSFVKYHVYVAVSIVPS